MRILYVILYVSLLSWNCIHAQTKKTLRVQNLSNDSVLAAFSQRFEVLDFLLNHIQTVDEQLVSMRSFSANTIDSVYEAKSMHERKAFKKKSGLELTGQTYYRLDDKFGFDEDNDRYSRYNAKLQGEVGWNIFNSSFLQRKSALRLIDLDNKAENLKQKEQYTEREWRNLESAIEEKYNALIASVLREQLQNIEVLNMAYQFTLENDRSSNEKLLEAMSEKMRIEHAITQVTGNVNGAKGMEPNRVEVVKPVMIEIDSLRLFESVLNHNTGLQIAHIQEEMLGVKRKLTNYAHGMRFTPFFRASHYFRPSLPSSTNTEVGVRFTFPLYDETSDKRKSMRTEQTIIALNRQHVSDNLLEQCRQLLSQFNRFNNAINAEQEYASQLRQFISIRKEAYLKSLKGYNYIARLEEYNEYLKSMERTYSLLLLRHLCLLDIQKIANCTDLTSMIRIKEISE